MARIVVFGATGYTGRLVVGALVRRGQRPVLAGRRAASLAALGDEHGGLETAVADVGRPESVRDLIGPGDVLVTTVGPFVLHGAVALEATIAAGAHYLDSTGEAAFIRRVVAESDRAAQAGCALLPAYGYDFVPGNIAAALAADEAGPAARGIEVVYAGLGQHVSSGTRASALLMAEHPTHRLSRRRLREIPAGREIRSFAHDGKSWRALLAGGTEPLLLPAAHPHLENVSVWLELGAAAFAAKAASYVAPVALRAPVLGGRLRSLARRAATTTGKGPDAEQRSRSMTMVVARAVDGQGLQLTRVALQGPDAYDITAEALAFGAITLAEEGTDRRGVIGPVELHGPAATNELLAELRLVRVG